MKIVLLVTWIVSGAQPNSYQVVFNSEEACKAARSALFAERDRIMHDFANRPQSTCSNCERYLHLAIIQRGAVQVSDSIEIQLGSPEGGRNSERDFRREKARPARAQHHAAHHHMLI